VREPDKQEEGDAARGQERRDLRRWRKGRRRGCACLRPGGARVFLAGRTLESIEEVAEGIRSAGGVAETAQVDALDERAVEEHADAVAEMTGGIDISFNLISYQDVQGTLLAEMPLRDFERPVTTALRTQFLTARAAARYMISQGSG
jgi:3-oxoacyl-[acyl-carrier protein] reductase